MSKHHRKHPYPDAPQTISSGGDPQTGRTTGGNVGSDTNRAEKARKEGQHSHGGNRP
ncbi:general stress protein [Pseudomonas taiwanensis]|uniref:general stress protein n=1 Tax=Pseudomonas taiwanensis TaxID=470150 RepID=UPI0015BC6052|nr:general stress protein [Pseudomonas taiwanensis]NWL76497.1 general stress protein [Pseudomonas taiwanensis]